MFCHLLVHINSMIILKSIYYAYFHSIIKYGITFWSKSFNIEKLFTLQKKVIRIMAGAQHKTSHRSLFEQLEILPVPCQYILLLINFIINNWEIFHIHLYTILIKGKSIIFVDQMPTYLVFRKVHSILA